MIETDVCIIGAGPAGLLASIYAAHKGAKTLVVETNSTPGLKLLRTGGGRCNLTHNLTTNEFIKAYGKSGRFLRFSLHEFSSESTKKFFENYGLKIKTDPDGNCFPITNRASDIKRALQDCAEALPIDFMFNSQIQLVEKNDNVFILQAPKEIVIAKAVILATGGCSWPQTGSCGDGYKFAKQLGHKIVEPKAALVPLITTDKWAHKLSGVNINKAALKANLGSAKVTTVGPILFTDNGLGGPAVLDFSRHITEIISENKPNTTQITIDLLPNQDIRQIDEHIMWLCQANPKKEIPGILSEFLPRNLTLRLCEEYDFLKNTISGQLTKENRRKLAELLKNLPFNIKSTRSINEAIITRGGISTNQIDDKTMQSEICPGLFFAGEIIDVDGPCGGFNLQICWSTGVVAGNNAGKLYADKK